MHFKFVLVNGIYDGDTSSKVVFTGSANWTNTALRYGNELMVKIADSKVHDKYVAQFEKLRTWARNIPPTPKPTPTPSPTPTPGPTGTPNPSATPGPTLGPSPDPSAPGETTPPEIIGPDEVSVNEALTLSGLKAAGLQGLAESLWLEGYGTPHSGPAEEYLPTELE